MREIIEMLALVKFSQANEVIQIAKGRYELPYVRFKRIFKKLILRNHG